MKRKRGMPIWLCLLIITIGAFMMISAFSDIQRYERVRDDALVVEAVVVEITSYEDGENEWKRAVGINEYNDERIGATMASVYFPKEKSPSLVYKHNLTGLA